MPMLAVEISRGALVSHRGTDSRHDSPTEFGGDGRAMGGRELIGHQTNMNNSRFEEMKLVYSSDEMCPTFDVFFFPRAIDSIYRSGNGVWAKKKKKKYNILLHLLQ